MGQEKEKTEDDVLGLPRKEMVPLSDEGELEEPIARAGENRQ
jgi:hypothetical protein